MHRLIPSLSIRSLGQPTVFKKGNPMDIFNVTTLLPAYCILINLVGFAMMGIDKYKAKKRAFRIPEATLFSIAMIGGSIGSIIGMYTFHHKTRHHKFTIGMPAILVIQLLLILLIRLAPVEIVLL